MSATTYLANLPPELITAVVAEASRDADHVVWFLDELLEAQGLRPAAGQRIPFPAGFLRDLGAALRILSWEQAGLQPQEVADLPSADEALRDVLRSLQPESLETEMANPRSTLAFRVMVAFIEHFAWGGRVELDAEVLLGEADEEALLEDLADFLWSHRPVGPNRSTIPDGAH